MRTVVLSVADVHLFEALLLGIMICVAALVDVFTGRPNGARFLVVLSLLGVLIVEWFH